MRPEDRLAGSVHPTWGSMTSCGMNDDDRSSYDSANDGYLDEKLGGMMHELSINSLERRQTPSELVQVIDTFRHQTEDLHSVVTQMKASLESHSHHGELLLQIVDAFTRQAQDLHKLFGEVKKERLELVALFKQLQEERKQDREQREHDKRDQTTTAEDISERLSARIHQEPLKKDTSEQDEAEEEEPRQKRRVSTRKREAAPPSSRTRSKQKR